ncbi:hypothetical protein TRVL_09514 [Trypanosoma vivax]|nr:hypothetical protein TRVL_09514 [Trypanosoma vivax]
MCMRFSCRALQHIRLFGSRHENWHSSHSARRCARAVLARVLFAQHASLRGMLPFLHLVGVVWSILYCAVGLPLTHSGAGCRRFDFVLEKYGTAASSRDSLLRIEESASTR